MANFDIFEWRQKHLLNESANNNISENFLNVVKKVIKDKYGEDASNDQIRFGDGSPISEGDFSQLNELLELGKKKDSLDSIPENAECSLDEERGRITEGICNVGIYVIATLLKSFPVLLSTGGPGYAKKFIKLIFDGNTPEIMNQVVDVSIQKSADPDEKRPTTVFTLLAFPTKQALGLFTTTVAAAVRIFQVAGAAACASLIGVDSLATFIIDLVDEATAIEPSDEKAWKQTIEQLIKKYNNTGRRI